MERRRTMPPALVYAFMALISAFLLVTLAGFVDAFWLALTSSAFFGTVGVLRVAGVLERPPGQGLRYDILYLLVGAVGLAGAALRFFA